MHDERGMALALTLIVMLAIAALTMALLGLAALEPALTANLSDSAQARFAAEAGIQWAANVIAGTTDWNTLLAGGGSSGVILNNPNPMPIGTLGSSRGTFTVRVRNDICAAVACPPPLSAFVDTVITGEATTDTGGTATQDTNAVLILYATGTRGTAVKHLVAAIKRVSLPPIQAALAFPGDEAQVNFNGNSFTVGGEGYHMDGTSDGGCAPVYGITAAGSDNVGIVQEALSSAQQDNVTGKNESGSGTASGNATITQEPSLTPAKIQTFVDLVKQSADISLQSHDPGLSYSNIGDSCATDFTSPTCWGTSTQPKIVYVKGDLDPTASFTALSLSGHSTGYGILVVENGELAVTGDFQWYGPIIVTGQWVGVAYKGGGNQQVYGAVIVNEMAHDPFMEGLIAGNAVIRYSCDALRFASNERRLTRVSNWREVQ